MRAGIPKPLAAFVAAAVIAAALCAALAPSALAVDDYPYKGLAPDALEYDEWGFFKATCTSFVAWRLIYTNGVADFGGGYGGAHWGNSDTWDDAARAAGITVDNNPAVGAIAQTDGGTPLGHVAWVAAVNGREVTIEEYNFPHRDAYGRSVGQRAYNIRTVDASAFCYIHVKDLDEPVDLFGEALGALTAENVRAAREHAKSPLALLEDTMRLVRARKAALIRARIGSRAAPERRRFTAIMMTK